MVMEILLRWGRKARKLKNFIKKYIYVITKFLSLPLFFLVNFEGVIAASAATSAAVTADDDAA